MTEDVWFTSSEAGVLVVHRTDPWGGWGYSKAINVPTKVIERYLAADREYWVAMGQLRQYEVDDD